MDGVVIRAPVDGDTGALGALVRGALARGDLAGSADPHGQWLARLALRTPEACAVAEAAGRLAGLVVPDAKTLVVEPVDRRRGIGRALADAGAAAERGRGRPDVILGVLPGDEVGEAFLRATGFAYHSTVWNLEVGRGTPAPPPAWPLDVRPRPIDGTRDLPDFVELFNAAFATHPTPLAMTLSDVATDWGNPLPASEDDILVLEEPGGSLVGFCATEPVRLPGGGVAPPAEISTIGVRPDAQGRGLGRQLLRWGVGYTRGLGVDTVALAVNGINQRALGLYESEGFVRTATRDRWARPVPTAKDPAALPGGS